MNIIYIYLQKQEINKNIYFNKSKNCNILYVETQKIHSEIVSFIRLHGCLFSFSLINSNYLNKKEKMSSDVFIQKINNFELNFPLKEAKIQYSNVQIGK